MRFLSWPLVPGFLLALPVVSAAQPIIYVPATYLTLQAAINSIDTAPEDGTIIEMANGTYDYGTFVSISNKPYRFAIRAAAGATVTLSGGGSHDILRFQNTNLTTGRPVVFERLIFANGFSSIDGVAGAVLMSHAEATFVSCTFLNNVANPANQGGAGVYLSGSRAHFVDALFSGNTSKNWGAALALVSTSSYGATAFIHNSRFLNNRVNLPNHLPNSSGGAIFATDAGAAFPAALRITNTRFEGNQAGYVGGAIYTLGFWTSPESVPKVDLICTNCTFVNNTAARDPSVAFPVPAIGGAVHVEDQSTARFFNSRFVTNSARQGGALSNYRAKLEIVGSAFHGNQATGTGSSEGLGGTIIALSADNIPDGTNNRRSAELTVRDTLLQGRYAAVGATGRQGGCVLAAGDVNRAWGLGGVAQMGTEASNRAVVNLDTVVFRDCDVAGDGSLPGAGGGLFASLTALTATNSLFINCDAAGGTSIFPAGGALALTDSSFATLSQTTLAKNSALSGGAIWSFGGTLNLTQCGVYENSLAAGNCGLPNCGSAINTSHDPGGGGRPPIGMTGLIQTSTFSNNAGTRFLFEQDQAAVPFNTVQYANNQIFPSNNVYWNPLSGGEQSVAGLNALVLHSLPKGVSNVGLVSAPVAGAMVAAPPNILSTNAAGDAAPPTTSYLGYAWTGGSATVNGGAVAGNAGVQAAASSGTQTLQVGASSFTDTVAAPAAPFLYLSANPSVLSAPGTSVLSWTTVTGSWLTNGIDQGTTLTPAISGGVTVSLNATTTYRGFLVAEEGGSVDSHSIWVSSDLIFKDGFQ